MRRFDLFVTKEDVATMEQIQQKNGLPSRASAMRWALRKVAGFI